MADAFKPLKCGELIRPYPYNVHKNWIVTDANYRGDYYGISILKGITPLRNQKINISESVDNVVVKETDELDNSLSNNNSALANKHQKVVWSSINQMFYKHRVDNERILYQSASIFSVPVNRMGDGIKPNSVRITDNSVTASIVASVTLADTKVNEYRGDIIDLNIDTSSYASSDNLIGYWGFNNELLNRIAFATDIKDGSGYNHIGFGRHITYVDGISTTGGQQLPSGTQIQLNGSSSYVRVDHTKKFGFNKDDSYSISLWATIPSLQFDTSSNTNWLVSKNGTYKDYGYDGILNATFNRRNIETSIYPFDLKVYNQLSSNDGRVVASVSDGLNTTSIQSNTRLNDGLQHHITFNKISSSLELWVDGVKEASASLSLNDNVNNEYDIVFGSKFLSDSGIDVVSSGFKSLSGSLDEIRIYNTNLSQQQIELLSNNDYVTGSAYQSNIVGEVFYKHGVVVISDPKPLYKNVFVGANGNWDYGSDRGFNVKYKSSKTLYEASLICEIGASEFNVSQNPSLRVNNDINNEILKGFVTGSDFRPYITTIGLYNDIGELLAIAKLGSALKKRYDTDLNVNVRFDLDGVFGTPSIGDLPQNINPTLYQSPSGGFVWNSPTDVVDWVSTTDNSIILSNETNVSNQLPNVPNALGLLAKSLDFDGVDEYIANGIYPNPFSGNNNFLFNNTDSFSLSIWFKLDAFFPSTQTPLMGLGNTSVQLGYFITTINSSQKIRFNIVSGVFTTVTGQFFIDTNDTINLNEWVNVICTYDGSQNINGAKVYINGVDNGATRTTTGTGLADDISYPTLPLKVFRGRSTDVANGKVNNVRIWSGLALSPTEVLDEYADGRPLYTAVQNSSLVLDLDIPNAFISGSEYAVTNLTGLGDDFVVYNSEDGDLIDDSPQL